VRPAPSRVEVAGVASARGQRPELSLPEVIFGVVSAALDDAGVGMADVDGVVIAAHDLIDGRSLSSMVTGPAAGAYLRDEMRVSDDGLVALSLGTARLQSGEANIVVVAAWGRASEGDPCRTSRVGFDPFTEVPLGLDDTVVSALRLSSYLGALGDPTGRDKDRRRASAARCARAGDVDVAWDRFPTVSPLRAEESGWLDDVAAAVVLRRGESGPWVAGVGHGTDRARVGDRRLHEFTGAVDAVRAAFAASDTDAGKIDVVEVAASTLTDEVLLLEASGLAATGTGFGAYADRAWVNPSGGSARGTCPPCTGLLALVESVHQLRGTAGPRQVEPRPVRALVAAGSTVALQTVTAVVLEAAS